MYDKFEDYIVLLIKLKTYILFLTFFIYFIFYRTYFFIVIIITVHCSCLHTHQKRASDHITDGSEPPYGCWELNSGPLEAQSVLISAPASYLQIFIFLNSWAFSQDHVLLTYPWGCVFWGLWAPQFHITSWKCPLSFAESCWPLSYFHAGK